MIRRAWHRATRTWREAAAIIADEQARAQTPAPPPFASPSGGGAGPAPAPGNGTPPQAAESPPRPSPAPGCRPRLLMSSRVYSDGVVFVDDHVKHTTTRFDPPPGDGGDWDDALRRLTDACD